MLGKLTNRQLYTLRAGWMELESLLDIVTRLGGERPKKRGSFSGRGNIFPFFKASRPALEHNQPPTQRVPGALSSEVKR